MPKIPIEKRTRSQRRWYLHQSRQARRSTADPPATSDPRATINPPSPADMRIVIVEDRDPKVPEEPEPLNVPEILKEQPDEEAGEEDALSILASDDEF